MANRISNLTAQIEYAAIHKDRVSNLIAQVEYAPFHKNRISNLILMVEYAVPPPRTRKYGPAIQ